MATEIYFAGPVSSFSQTWSNTAMDMEQEFTVNKDIVVNGLMTISGDAQVILIKRKSDNLLMGAVQGAANTRINFNSPVTLQANVTYVFARYHQATSGNLYWSADTAFNLNTPYDLGGGLGVTITYAKRNGTAAYVGSIGDRSPAAVAALAPNTASSSYSVTPGMYWALSNLAPNAPSGLTPGGASASAPSTVRTLTPALSWTFSDPDAGNTPSAYQVQVFTTSGTLLHDSGQVTSAASSYTVPSSVGLLPNTVYNWTVRTWDNSGAVGPYAPNVYIKTSQAPTLTLQAPGNASTATPDSCSTTPRLSWIYNDAENDAQSTYQVRVYNASTGLLAYDSGQIVSASTSHTVPSGALGSSIKFYWNVTVTDGTGMAATSANGYILTNTPPAPVTLVSPTDTYRVGLRPVFVANTGDDPENDKQNFKIQLADNSSFTVNLKEMSTATATTGWEAYNGTAWVAFPSGGVDSTFEGKQVRYTWQSDLTEGKTYYWRIAPIDGTTGTLGNWSSTRTLRVGDTLQFKLKNPTKTTAAAKKIVLTGVRKVATDGTAPSVLKVEVCNNGLDATPTWEDATAYFLNGQTYVFTNTAKTGTDWAVDCRVTIKANDSLGAIEFDGLGFSFM